MAALDFRTRLARRATRAGISVTDELLERLDTYFALLLRWNAKINLTALGDTDEALDRLILEPLLAARHVPQGAECFIDIGSGGGSPAIPLALASNLAVTLVEVKVRKSAFLREALRKLELRGEVRTSKVEELLAEPALHERFPLATMRAVRVDPKMLLTAQAFVNPGGHLFLFRGPAGPAIPQLVPPLSWVQTYPLVDTLQSRVSVLRKLSIGLVV